MRSHRSSTVLYWSSTAGKDNGLKSRDSDMETDAGISHAVMIQVFCTENLEHDHTATH